MAKYICSKCNEVFTHTAKLVESNDGSDKAIAMNTGTLFVLSNHVETQVCPFCHNVKFAEYQEPEADIVSLRKVNHDNVDAMIQQGYKVKEIYAQYVIMVKTEVPAVKPKVEPAALDGAEATVESGQLLKTYVDEANAYRKSLEGL